MVDKNKRWRPDKTDLNHGPVLPTINDFREAGSPPPPAEREQKVLHTPHDVGDALISAWAAGELREAVPKKVDSLRGIAGAGPAADYFVLPRGPVPEGHVYHIHTVLHSATQFDASLAGCTDVLAQVFVCVDQQPILYDEIRSAGTSIAAVIAYDFEMSNIIEVDYWAAQGSLINIFSHTVYTLGGALATMDHNTIVLGNLYQFDEEIMGHGDATSPANTAAEFAIYQAKFNL
jgi:hypothetical protein